MPRQLALSGSVARRAVTTVSRRSLPPGQAGGKLRLVAQQPELELQVGQQPPLARDKAPGVLSKRKPVGDRRGPTRMHALGARRRFPASAARFWWAWSLTVWATVGRAINTEITLQHFYELECTYESFGSWAQARGSG